MPLGPCTFRRVWLPPVFGDKEVTLWTYTNPDYIPTLPAAFLFNEWHLDNWWTGGAADDPAADGTMRIDWFR